ncbi:MAG: hypothetical protein AAB502_06930, partial [Chloroflexota bacterium]
MTTIQELLKRNIDAIKLRILIFGPALEGSNDDPRVIDLRKKRKQIREYLEKIGHHVAFPEEIVDPNADPPANNPVVQEILLVKDYDFVINLIETSGTNVELGMFCTKEDCARKTHLF